MRNARWLALGLTVASLAATLLAEIQAWPLVLIAGMLALALTWVGAERGSIVAAPITLLALAMLFAFAQDGLAIGPLAACVLALVLADVLAAMRSEDDRGPASIRTADLVERALRTAAVATGAIVVVMLVALVPAHRTLTLAAVVALVGLAALVTRRRTTMPHAPLPPPPAGGPVPPA